MTYSHCSQLDLAAGVITFGDGVFTLMGANGDTVTATYGNGIGSIQPDGTIPYTYEVTIGGGTGRFAGATGHATVNGMVLFLDLTGVSRGVETHQGWIAYDASQQS